MKKCFIIFFVVFFFTTKALSGEKSNGFLILTDIHFTPFSTCSKDTSPCPLIMKLEKSPVTEWTSILQQNDSPPINKRQDSNYVLFQSSLNAASTLAHQQHLQFILLLGDILGHNFRENYKLYSNDKTEQGYQAFIEKIQAFLFKKIAESFPRISVYYTIGNDDSDKEDYHLQSDTNFLKNISYSLISLIHEKENRQSMQKTFLHNGYYSIIIKNKLRIILFNSVLCSRLAIYPGMDNAAHEQFQWLHQELMDARERKQSVWIAMHIPEGIDVFASENLFKIIKRLNNQPVSFWKQWCTDAFNHEIDAFSDNITSILTAHTHADWFQILPTPTKSIPMIGTPSISPIFGNNPGFKLYYYDTHSHELINSKTFYYNEYSEAYSQEKKWQEEYDFNQIYQPNCGENRASENASSQLKNCRLLTGMQQLEHNNSLEEFYRLFYSVSSQDKDVLTYLSRSFHSRLWCAVFHVNPREYETCKSQQ